MNSTDLKQDITAYDRHHVLDNQLTLDWYPGRVVRMAGGGSMLELGLGHGYSTRMFAKSFDRYVVVEGSQEMLERFQARFSTENVDVRISYFEDFETEERFDAIGMGFVLEHVEDPALILRRFASFLAPGGRIYIAVPNAEALHRRLGHAAGMLPDMTRLSEADLDFGHRRYFTCETLRALVGGEGLEVDEVEGILLKPVTTGQLVSLALDERIHQAMLEVGVDYPELCNSILMSVKRPGD